MSNLLCCNCQAVYGDPGDKVKNPICPYCNVSHYEETLLNTRPPRKLNYKFYPQITETIDDRWLPYYILQNLVEGIPEIDLEDAHRIGLQWVGREVCKVPFYKILAALESNAVKRHWAREVPYDECKHNLSDPVDTEYNLLVTETVDELRQAWNNRRSEKYTCTLDEMLDFNKREARRAGKLNKYYALRNKLASLRKRLNPGRLNETISTVERENK